MRVAQSNVRAAASYGGNRQYSSGPVKLSDVGKKALKKLSKDDSPKHGGSSKPAVYERRTKVPQQKKWEDTDKESWKEWDYRSFQTNQRRKPKHFGEGSDQEPVTEDGATAHEDESPADSKTAAKKEKELARAKLSAAGSLSYKQHNRQELKEKLVGKGYSPEVAEQALDRMEELDLLDDSKFAEVYARSKWHQSKWSPTRISRELQKRGVSSTTTKKAMDKIFGVNAGGLRVDDNAYDMAEEAAEYDPDTLTDMDSQLVEAVQKRLLGMSGVSKEAQKRRSIGWMQRRGYTWDVISSVLIKVGLLS